MAARAAPVGPPPEQSGPPLTRGRGICLKHGIRHDATVPRDVEESTSQWALRVLKDQAHESRRGVLWRYQPGDSDREVCEHDVTFVKIVTCLIADVQSWAAHEIPAVEFMVAKKPLATIVYRYRSADGQIHRSAIVPHQSRKGVYWTGQADLEWIAPEMFECMEKAEWSDEPSHMEETVFLAPASDMETLAASLVGSLCCQSEEYETLAAPLEVGDGFVRRIARTGLSKRGVELYAVGTNLPSGSSDRRTPWVEVRLEGRTVVGAIDTGAQVSVISYDVFETLGSSWIDLPAKYERERLIGYGSAELEVVAWVRVPIQIGPHVYHWPTYVVRKAPLPLLIGDDFLTHNGCRVDYQNMKLDLRRGASSVILRKSPTRQALQQELLERGWICDIRACTDSDSAVGGQNDQAIDDMEVDCLMDDVVSVKKLKAIARISQDVVIEPGESTFVDAMVKGKFAKGKDRLAWEVTGTSTIGAILAVHHSIQLTQKSSGRRHAMLIPVTL